MMRQSLQRQLSSNRRRLFTFASSFSSPSPSPSILLASCFNIIDGTDAISTESSKKEEDYRRRRYYHGTPIFCKKTKDDDDDGDDDDGRKLVLYNSLSNSYQSIPSSPPSTSEPKEEKENMKPKGLAWYTCGPTVYDSAHLGHARTYICLDIIRRILHSLHSSSSGQPEPLFVMNITDIDDKILNKAHELDVSPIDLARRCEEEFWHDLKALNVLKPHVITRVTEHVHAAIIPYITQILENGMAYVLPEQQQHGEEEDGTKKKKKKEEGSVYFDVRAFEFKQNKMTKYGKLAPPVAATTPENSEFFSWQEEGEEEEGKKKEKKKVVPRKKDPRDFVLWKSRDESEDKKEFCWDSPWGYGRPGWHIECSAMIDYTMSKFPSHEIYVHAGGIDLKFPHHTNEIAQAEAYHYNSQKKTQKQKKEEWIPHWVHTGHLHIQGLKMSKSLKNFITVRDLLSSSTTTTTGESNNEGDGQVKSSSLSSVADDFRLWCLGLSGSYSGPATYSEKRLDEARILREKMVRFLLDGEEWMRQSSSDTHQPPRLWGEAEYDLFQVQTEVASNFDTAITGCASSSSSSSSTENSKTMADYDLDGSTIVREMVRLAEAGSSYISSSKVGEHPIEAIEGSMKLLRKNLSLLGFTDKTVRAGIANTAVGGDMNNDGHGSSNIEGGERALVEELVSFRSAIRKSALSQIRSKDSSSSSNADEAMHEILKLCDDARDKTLPAIGLDISDGTIEDGEDSQWRFCVPRKEAESYVAKQKKSPKKKAASTTPTTLVPPEEMFRVGQYEGMFSQYDKEGMPTHNSDGSEVSKRLIKKLKKKRDKYIQRLQK